MLLRSPTSSLFPYTTLFRSLRKLQRRWCAGRHRWNDLDGGNDGGGWNDRDRRGDSDGGCGWQCCGLVRADSAGDRVRAEEHTSELQSQSKLVCRPQREKKKS